MSIRGGMGGDPLKVSIIGAFFLFGIIWSPRSRMISLIKFDIGGNRFKFAKDNDVILIDEYDRINLDILPFYSLPPPVLLSRAYELSQDADTHTFVVKDGEVEITGPMKELARAGDQRELMKRYKQWLPDMNITISAHDGPSVLLDWRQKERHLTAAKEGKCELRKLPPPRLCSVPTFSPD